MFALSFPAFSACWRGVRVGWAGASVAWVLLKAPVALVNAIVVCGANVATGAVSRLEIPAQLKAAPVGDEAPKVVFAREIVSRGVPRRA